MTIKHLTYVRCDSCKATTRKLGYEFGNNSNQARLIAMAHGWTTGTGGADFCPECTRENAKRTAIIGPKIDVVYQEDDIPF